MVVIRLSRAGAKKRPFYHVVVTNSRNARDSGRFIERVGYFNPQARGSEIHLHFDKERVDYWTANGAQASERVQHLLKEFVKNPQPELSQKSKQTAAKKSTKTAEAA